jgi:hypothetical protein
MAWCLVKSQRQLYIYLLEYATRKPKENYEGMELNVAHFSPVYAAIPLCWAISTEVGLDINTQESNYIFIWMQNNF